MSRMQSTSGDDDDIFYDLEIIYSTDFLDSESDPAEDDLDDDFELKEWSNEHGEKGESEFDDYP